MLRERKRETFKERAIRTYKERESGGKGIRKGDPRIVEVTRGFFLVSSPLGSL